MAMMADTISSESQHVGTTIEPSPLAERLEFQYTALDYSKPSIRQIRILPDLSTEGYVQCEVRHTTIDDTATPYTCLSYVWGPEDKGSWITLDGLLFRVRENLATFLRYARADSSDDQLENAMPGWIWIDALCIDQKNTEERNHQVQQMGRIYTNAMRVLSWLGSDRKIAEYLKDARRGVFRPPDERLRALLASVYWDRAWITQEVAIARQVVLRARNMHAPMSQLPWYSLENYSTASEHAGVQTQRLLRFSPDTQIARLPKDLIRLLWSNRNTWCTFPRDRIYSLLYLCALESTIKVDYTITHDMVAINTLKACQSLCLSSVGVVGDALGLTQPAETGHPVAEIMLPAKSRTSSGDYIGVSIEPGKNRGTIYTIHLAAMCKHYYREAIAAQTFPGVDAFSYYGLALTESTRDTKAHEFLERSSCIWIDLLPDGTTYRIGFSLAFLLEISRTPGGFNQWPVCTRVEYAPAPFKCDELKSKFRML
jgi:hypothetical protein